ncbi:group 1 glycosyl transferase [Chondrocystis sp. NIES-4102]|nr:group 1 glycosyl transferase [Chondrocystis sp. NIES-4102]
MSLVKIESIKLPITKSFFTLKVLILSSKDLDGGAARSAYRQHQGLLAAGINSQMLVQNKQSVDNTVVAPTSKIKRGVAVIKPTVDQYPLTLYRNRDRTINIFSSQWLPNNITKQIEQLNPDLINLHWVCGGFVPIEALAKFKVPIVWTLHDMWAFTGGCHYSGNCDRYQQFCGCCPQLGSNHRFDLSAWNWQRKAKAWKDLNLTIVTPSNWLAQCAKNSSLFEDLPVKVIGYGIDPQLYQPHPTHLARKILNLPQDKKIILFGALNSTQDLRKGFSLLVKALQNLRQLQSNQEVELVIFGASEPANPVDFGYKTRYLGKLNDDITLSLVYAAADVFVAPSTQDNLPNTVLEALFCGTPCVAFNIGGMSDLIEHQQTGYLAKPLIPEDLAQGIGWVLLDEERSQQLRVNSRLKAIAQFSLKQQTQRYLEVFEKLCSNLAV